jgi:hypothetical protein
MSDSIFLPGTKVQYAYDSTTLGWLKECPRKYYYATIVGWRPKGEAVNLRFGSLYHGALELYDRRVANGASPEDAILDAIHYCLRETWDNGAPWVSDHNSKTRENLIRSVVWYLDQFGASDPAKTIILSNGKPAVELSFKLNLNWGPQPDMPYLLCGHLDRLVEYSSGTYAADRKTTGTTITPSYFEQYDPDNQMSLYTLAAKVIYNTPIKGVIIDAAQIAVGFTRFARGFTYRTEAQVEEWLVDLRFWFQQQAYFAEKDYWPMNDRSCHKYGGCPFRKVCSKSPEQRDIWLKSDYEIVPWNPLRPR